MKKLSKTARVRQLVQDTDMTPQEIAAKLKVPVSLVYTVRWQEKKTVKRKRTKKAVKKVAKKVAKSKNTLPKKFSLAEPVQAITIPIDREVEVWKEVNHPEHYLKGGVETIDFIEAKDLSYNLGNTVKYISRVGMKGDARVNLEKARWYLSREIDKYTDNERF